MRPKHFENQPSWNAWKHQNKTTFEIFKSASFALNSWLYTLNFDSLFINTLEHTSKNNIAASCLIIIPKVQVQQHDFSARDQLTCPHSEWFFSSACLSSIWGRYRQRTMAGTPELVQTANCPVLLFLVMVAALQRERGDSKSLNSGNT